MYMTKNLVPRIFIATVVISAAAAAVPLAKSKFPFLQNGIRKRSHLSIEDNIEWRKITDCIQPIYDPGHYVYRSPGHESDSVDTCGLFIITSPDKVVHVEVDLIDVSCQSGGLLAFFDGWEMSGKIFPSESDHELPLRERITEFCGQEGSQDLKFKSHQNAALIQYRVPKAGEGFSVKITLVDNPKPCNILMSEMTGVFTLTNYGGENRNCTLTTLLFPATFQIAEFNVGTPRVGHGVAKKTKIITKDESPCGMSDFLEIGGSSDLETTELETKEDICDWPTQKSVTVLCGSSTLRLVSSGNFANSLTVLARAADDEDLMDSHSHSVLVCPTFA